MLLLLFYIVYFLLTLPTPPAPIDILATPFHHPLPITVKVSSWTEPAPNANLLSTAILFLQTYAEYFEKSSGIGKKVIDYLYYCFFSNYSKFLCPRLWNMFFRRKYIYIVSNFSLCFLGKIGFRGKTKDRRFNPPPWP